MVVACSMRTRAAGFADGAEAHASSRRDRNVAQRADRDRAGIGERMAGVHRRDQLLVRDDHGLDPQRGLTRRSDQGKIELPVPEQPDQAVGIVLGQGEPLPPQPRNS